MSNSIHSALDTIAGFWSPCSSIGARGNSVGLHSVDNRSNRRNSIRARDHRGSRINGEDAIIARIGTQIGKKLGLERQNGAVLADSGLHAGMQTPAMTHRDDIVLAALQPSYRSLQLLCQECRHDLFTTEPGLAAKGSPTCGTVILMSVGAMCSVIDSWRRAKKIDWLEIQTERVPSACPSAIMPRGSIGTSATRGCRRYNETILSAWANPASTSPTVFSLVTAILLCSLKIFGPSSWRAASSPPTEGNTS